MCSKDGCITDVRADLHPWFPAACGACPDRCLCLGPFPVDGLDFAQAAQRNPNIGIAFVAEALPWLSELSGRLHDLAAGPLPVERCDRHGRDLLAPGPH